MEDNLYDLILSLGGNCSAASQIGVRKLRRFSLPFDWIVADDNRALEWLIAGLETGWKDLLLPENVVTDDNPHFTPGPGLRQVLDTVSHYRSVHDFPIRATAEDYARIQSTYRRRIDRLLRLLPQCRRVLLFFTPHPAFPIDERVLVRVKEAFARKYPETSFVLKVVRLTQQGFDVLPPWKELGEGVSLLTIDRPLNSYDFHKSNYEWSFLDKIRLSDLFAPVERVSVRKKLVKAIKFLLPYGLVRFVQRLQDEKAEKGLSCGV